MNLYLYERTATEMQQKSMRKRLGALMGRSKKLSAKWIALALVVAMLGTCAALIIGNTSYVVYVDGEAVCSVNDKETFDKAMLLLDEVYAKNGVYDRTDSSITCKTVLSSASEVDAQKCAELIFARSTEDLVRGYRVSLKGISIGFCSTYREAEKVVESFNKYVIDSIKESNGDIGEVELTSEIEITYTVCRADRILSADDICREVLNAEEHYGSSEDASSSDKVVADGGLSFLYADKNFSFGMLKNEAEIVLPEFDFSFNLGELNSSIEYKTTVTEKYSEIIPYETTYVETDELYKGKTKVVFEGENGLAENTYEIAYVDGKQISKVLVESVVVSEPVNRIEYVGTKEPPITAPTGSFAWPIQRSFQITSRFGEYRNGLDNPGSPHKALDIAGIPVGTAVYSADGGTVTFAGTYSTYGLLIIVEHEDGVETRYAHLDKLHVKAGDKVYKGQRIGDVGMTGRTTGPHLHFEVRINGTPVNPENYLPNKKP